jgi:hypothetical protein
MRRVVLKSPVLENCTPGSVRGALGNQRPYLANGTDYEGKLVGGGVLYLRAADGGRLIRNIQHPTSNIQHPTSSEEGRGG